MLSIFWNISLVLKTHLREVLSLTDTRFGLRPKADYPALLSSFPTPASTHPGFKETDHLKERFKSTFPTVIPKKTSIKTEQTWPIVQVK